MSEIKTCPLKPITDDNRCTANCAWNTGSVAEPECAIVKISRKLSNLASK